MVHVQSPRPHKCRRLVHVLAHWWLWLCRNTRQEMRPENEHAGGQGPLGWAVSDEQRVDVWVLIQEMLAAVFRRCHSNVGSTQDSSRHQHLSTAPPHATATPTPKRPPLPSTSRPPACGFPRPSRPRAAARSRSWCRSSQCARCGSRQPRALRPPSPRGAGRRASSSMGRAPARQSS